MKFQFKLNGADGHDFKRAVVWVYHGEDDSEVVTCADAQTTDGNGSITANLDDRDKNYRVRVIVYYNWDVVPKRDLQDVHVYNVKGSDNVYVENRDGQRQIYVRTEQTRTPVRFYLGINRSDFHRAVIWVYHYDDGAKIATCYNREVNVKEATIEWPAPDYKAGYTARILVYYINDVVPPEGVQDVWVDKFYAGTAGIHIRNIGSDKAITAFTEESQEHENWMKDQAPKLADRRLGRILIPCTHDAGSFGLIAAFAQTQERDFGAQLRAGIRALDLRIAKTTANPDKGYEPNTYYLHHGIAYSPSMKLDPHVEVIRKFADEHPTEVLLLYCGQYDIVPPKPAGAGMSPAEFADYLNTKLVRGDGRSLIFRPRTGQTLGEIRLREISPNIVLIGDDGGRGLFWPGSTSWDSYDYVSYISKAGINWSVEIDAKEIQTVRDDQDGVKKVADDTWYTKGDKVPGFYQQTNALLARRKAAMDRIDAGTAVAPADDIGRVLGGTSTSFSNIFVESVQKAVHDRMIKWIKDWEQNASTAGALNVIGLDFYNHSTIVSDIITANTKRPDATAKRQAANQSTEERLRA